MSQTATQPPSVINLIMSGTPAGVGPVNAGDKLEGHVDGVGDLTVTYARSKRSRREKRNKNPGM